MRTSLCPTTSSVSAVGSDSTQRKQWVKQERTKRRDGIYEETWWFFVYCTVGVFPCLVVLTLIFCDLLMVVKSWHCTQTQGFLSLAMYALIIGGQRCWEVKLIQIIAVALFLFCLNILTIVTPSI